MWFTLFGDSPESTTKTSVGTARVLEHKGFDEIETEPSESVLEAVTKLTAEVQRLKTAKADDLLIDNEAGTLSLLSGDEVISEVELPQEVHWTNWHEQEKG